MIMKTEERVKMYKSKMIETAKKYIGSNYKHFCSVYKCGCTAWCAIFISVCARESGNSDIFPWSASCNDISNWFKARGQWHTNIDHIQPGDIIIYDWDKINEAKPYDHIGVVETVNGSNITVIEGNYGNAANDKTVVSRRKITASYPYIVGFARPNYVDAVSNNSNTVSNNSNTVSNSNKNVSVNIKQISKGDNCKAVKVLQSLLISEGYSCGPCGADGDFGQATAQAVRKYQLAKGLDVDGIVGKKTWNSLLS